MTDESAARAAGSAPGRAQARDGLHRPDSARSSLLVPTQPEVALAMMRAMHGRQPSGKAHERYFGGGVRNLQQVMLLLKHDPERFVRGCERIHAAYQNHVEKAPAKR